MKLILLVEDDQDILSNISSVLRFSGYKILTAENALKGLELLKHNSPDLIISDIMMPGLSGYEFKETLSADSKTSCIPFIFLTAKAEYNDLRNGMDLGADDYIIKPVKTNDLLKIVETRLKRIDGFKEHLGKAKLSSGKEKKSIDRIFIDQKDQQIILKIEEIKVIKADSGYSLILTKNHQLITIRKLMKDWENILPEDIFLRIHRSVIINLECVVKIEKWFKRTYKIYLQNEDKPFDISQRYALKIKDKLGI